MDTATLLEEASTRSGVSEIVTRKYTMFEMVEKYFNRELRGVSNTEKILAISTDANGDYTLPTDFNGVKALYKNNQRIGNKPLDQVKSLQDKDAFYISNGVLKNNMKSQDFTLHYFAKLPSLNSNTTNWLLTEEPEIYLNALMWQGFLFASIKADNQDEMQMYSVKIPALKSYLDQIIYDFKTRDRLNKIGGSRVSIKAVQ